MQVLASQLHFLANRNTELAVPPLFLPVNCIKIGGQVALLSCPCIYFLFYAGTYSCLIVISTQSNCLFPVVDKSGTNCYHFLAIVFLKALYKLKNGDRTRDLGLLVQLRYEIKTVRVCDIS